MELKTLLLSTLIFLYNFEYLKTDSNLPVKTRLPNDIKPLSYDIHLTQAPSFNNGFSNGSCRVIIHIIEPTHNISFHAKKPQINIYSLSLTENLSKYVFIPKRYKYYEESHIVDVYFDDTLYYGYYTIDMKFKITPVDDGEGLIKVSYINRKSLFATQFHAIGARRMFPCWDEPAYKATFNISIEHHRKYTALSNMPIRDMEIQKINITEIILGLGARYMKEIDPIIETGRVLTYFKVTPRISTYRLAIMLSDSSIFICGNNLCHTEQLTPYLRFATTIAANVTKYFEYKEKPSTIFSRVNHVVIPGFPRDSTENLGLSFHRDTIITYDEKSDPAAHKFNVAYVVARAVTREFVNNRVTPVWWVYMWINEGISVLLTIDAINEIYPDSRMLDLFVVQIQQESLRLDTDSIMKPLTPEGANFGNWFSPSEINSLFSFAYYLKAPAILRMLQQVLNMLTDRVFSDGIKKFLDDNEFARPSELWTAMQDVVDEYFGTFGYLVTFDATKFDIEKAMNPWTQLKQYPVLEVIQHNFSYVKISLENYGSLNQKTLWIPVTVLYWRDINVNISRPFPVFIAWLSPSEQDVYISDDHFHDLIIINFKQAGYYRVKYFVENWRKIAKYLNTTKYTLIHVLNRAQIIDDAFYFLMKDQLDLSVFLELTEYLKQETDYVAWYPMIKALEYMSCYFSFDESAYIKEYMRDILNELLNNIGYTSEQSDNDLTKCLRQEAARWACILGDDKCKLYGLYILSNYVGDPVKNKFLSSWKEWTYYDLNPSDTWWAVFFIWEKTCDNKVLEFLSCSVSPSNVHYYLDRIINISQDLGKCNFRVLGKDVNMLIRARLNSFLLTVAKHANNKIVHEYLIDHFEKVKPREVSICAILVVIVNHVYSEEQIDQVTIFVENYYKRKEIFYTSKVQRIDDIFFSQKDDKEIREGIQNYIERVISIIRDKIRIRANEIAKQRSIFKILGKNGTKVK